MQKIPEGSLFLAPMEGITDDSYRQSIEEAFGGWDFYACDFLRVSTVSDYKDSHIINHYGEKTFHSPYLREKTYYQVLLSSESLIEKTLPRIENLGFEWLDINLGCPSQTVCKNQGGSYLLSDIKLLDSVLKRVRASFSKFLTAKIRVGYKDDKNFLNILSCLEGNGIQAITIHGRTKTDLYKGRASWDYIKQAVQFVDLPIIGNGDIWSVSDIERIFDETQCHGVMMARSALKSPWLAREYKNPSSHFSLPKEIDLFLQTFQRKVMEEKNPPAPILLKILKGLSRYLFDDLRGGQTLKSQLLQSQSLGEYQEKWDSFLNSLH